MRERFGFIPLLLLAGLLWACGGDRALQSALDSADALMESRPDSALALLQPYDTAQIKSEEQRARFALLYSMALDKNYIDRKDFKTLQPALDYYPTHGTDADKIRTLYYAGCIYQNAKNKEKAMEAWAEALQYRGPKTDSLVLAHLLVNQGNEYFRLRQFDKFTENQRQAEEIYRSLGRKDFADKAFLNRFELALNRDTTFAKASIGKVAQLALDSVSFNGELARSKALQYEMHLGTPASLDARLKEYAGYPIDSLDLTQALLNLGRISEAESILMATQPDSALLIKYLLRKQRLEKAKGNFEEALKSSEQVLKTFDQEQSEAIEGDAQYAEERFQWRSEVEKHKRAERNALIFGAVALFVLVIAVGIFVHRFRMRRLREDQLIASILAEHTAEMKQKIAVLENEKATLSELLAKASEPSELPDVIKERLAEHDRLLCDALKNSKGNYDELVVSLSSIIRKSTPYLVTSGKVLEARYPRETAELRKKGLTHKELGFISLYLMNLRGKDIINLLSRTDPYKISSGIRKKLGLDSDEGNIDHVVRRMFPVTDIKQRKS